MIILNQPNGGNLGSYLQDILSNKPRNGFDTFYFAVAYARKAGIARLEPYMKKFVADGGKIKAVVGIGQKNTSIQGLKMLLEICTEVNVYHNERFTHTFHPKAYAFEKDGEKAVVFIGSNNLTSGGLYTNYEATSICEYNLSSIPEKDEFEKFKESFNKYSGGSTCSKKLTDRLVSDLSGGGYLCNEEVEFSRIRKMFASRGTRRRIFGSESFEAPRLVVIREEDQVEEEVSGVSPINEGFWKKLSPNDVSRTSSPGQIIIPIGFKELMPPFTEWQNMDNGAMQSEMYFNVIFIDEDGKRIRINKVRSIYYIPAPHHLRKNHEIRFTFRNREISNKFKEGDVLDFRRSDNPDVWFLIRLIRKDTEEYVNLGSKKFDFIQRR